MLAVLADWCSNRLIARKSPARAALVATAAGLTTISAK